MAKRQKKDTSCFSMNSIIRQILMDGKIHTAKDIAIHMKRYMYKTDPLPNVTAMIQMMLDHHKDIEKSSKGYKLKTGESLMNCAIELIEEAPGPMLKTEIIKLIAEEQDIPEDGIELDLDADPRIAKVSYKSKTYYYLASRKKINNLVYDILKEKDRPMSLNELYKVLETEHNLPRKEVIFLPQEDSKIKRQVGSKFALNASKPKKKQTVPLHLVSKPELELVVDYLKDSGEHLSASDIADKVLNLKLESTNLRVKLSKEKRLRRENELYYFEQGEKSTEIPQKVKERVASLYFRVKARLVGSQEVNTVESLLDRVYKINISHVEYHFYRMLLEDKLRRDEGIVRLIQGWIRADNDNRTEWTLPPSFAPIRPLSPPSLLAFDQLTPEEHAFLAQEFPATTEKNMIVHRVTPSQWYLGIIPMRPDEMSVFPVLPQYYELRLIDEDSHDEFIGFVNRKYHVLSNLSEFFKRKAPIAGALLRISSANDSDAYRFIVSIKTDEGEISMTADDLDYFNELVFEELNLYELIERIYQRNPGVSLSQHYIWAAVNAVRSVSRQDILAVLKDYRCFVPDETAPGFYLFDSSVGDSRRSIDVESVAEPEALELIPVVESELEHVVPDLVEIPTVSEKVLDEELVDLDASKFKKQEIQKKRPKKRKDDLEEELPEHLLRLKAYERKLPRLRANKPVAVKPSQEKQSPVPDPVSVISIGRPEKQESSKKQPKKPKEKSHSLLTPTPLPAVPEEWNSSVLVNPDKGTGHSELHRTLEVLKTFVSRTPQVRRSDGSIVVFLDNDVPIYFRIPPENPNCWIAWIPEEDLQSLDGYETFLLEETQKAKYSDKGYWWATEKFRGPKGNSRDRNVLEGVQIVAKILELMEKQRKTSGS